MIELTALEVIAHPSNVHAELYQINELPRHIAQAFGTFTGDDDVILDANAATSR
jgi:hypothetical protein